MTEKQGIIAHTQVQYDMFLRWHNLPPQNFYRIRELRDVEARGLTLPILILPEARATKDFNEILRYIRYRAGKVEWLSEEQAREANNEVKTDCPFDTNQDGDCHLCARKGGCQWPLLP